MEADIDELKYEAVNNALHTANTKIMATLLGGLLD